MSEVSLHKLYSDEPEFGDFFSLLKPRVMSLVVFTAIAGLLAAPGDIHPFVAIVSIIFIALGGGASGALNMWYDADIDSIMSRTKLRPVPAGKISANDAKYIGIVLSAISVVMLGLASNWLAAFLLAFTIFFYVIVYTIWLKRATPQNIVIGGAAGAFPPIIGWAVVTGNIGFESILMFALIFVWTPPHFWSLALFMKNDYDSAKVPMLTVTNGRKSTRNHIFVYSLILALVALSVGLSSLSGPIYWSVAIALNIQLIVSAFKLRDRSEDECVSDNSSVERKFFKFSLLYLFLHFGAIIVETKTNIAWPGF
jgi:protoheme IX farnesyltransferase